MKLGLMMALIVFGLLTNPTMAAAPADPPSLVNPAAETRLCGANRARVIDAVTRASEHYTLPTRLTMGLIWVESDCRPDAVSSAGAVGLMQVMPREVGYQFRDRPTSAQLRDIDTNVMWGSYILQEMDSRYCGLWHRYNSRYLSKSELGYWQCALGAFWGGTQVYFSGRLTPNEQSYADMVIGAARRVDISR